MDSWLCTLAQVRGEIKAEQTRDDEHLRRLIPSVSAEIEAACRGWEFEPLRDTRTVYPNAVTVSSDYRALDLRMPVLELVSVTNGTKVLTIGTDVELVVDPAKPERTKLRLIGRGLSWTKGCGACGSAPYSVTVTAVWGMRDDYALEGWRLADKLGADMAIDAGTLVVDGGIALVGVDGFEPRFSPGTLIKIDSEMMRVHTTTEPKTLGILRAQRGSAAATHTQNTPVYVWTVQQQIQRACVRWTTLWYGRRGVFDTAQVTDIGFLKLPGDMPEDVRNSLRRFLK